MIWNLHGEHGIIITGNDAFMLFTQSYFLHQIFQHVKFLYSSVIFTVQNYSMETKNADSDFQLQCITKS